MRTQNIHKLFTIFGLLVLLVTACSAGGQANPPSGTPGSAINTPALSVSAPSEEVRGPGSFDLANATVGLDKLDSYQATFTSTFNGVALGANTTWSKTYQLSVSKARQARVISLADDIPAPEASMNGWVFGQADGLVYNRLGADAPCVGEFFEAQNAPDVIELTQLIPVVMGAEVVNDNETLFGISTSHYSIDERAIGLAGIGTAKGEIWIDNQWGYVVKFTLQVHSDQGIYDSDLTGTMTWDYQLDSINQPFDITLPQDCPGGMIDIPIPDQAQAVTTLPGYISYLTNEAVTDVAEYYQSALLAAGYQAEGADLVNNYTAVLDYTKDKRYVSVQIVSGEPAQVQLFMAYEPTRMIDIPEPTLEPGVAEAVDASTRISNSMGLLLGDDTTLSVLPSYHLELNHTIPMYNESSGAFTTKISQVSADVQGADIHLAESTTSPDGSARETEGYLVNGTNYLVVDGKVQEDISGIEMTWLFWPIDVTIPLILAGMGPEAQGSDTIDGRLADKYDIDTARADPASLEIIRGMLPSRQQTTEAHGTVWIDQETGALLKLYLDYTSTYKTEAGNEVGSAPGHIEIMVTQVGQVTVSLP